VKFAANGSALPLPFHRSRRNEHQLKLERRRTAAAVRLLSSQLHGLRNWKNKNRKQLKTSAPCMQYSGSTITHIWAPLNGLRVLMRRVGCPLFYRHLAMQIPGAAHLPFAAPLKNE